MGHVIILCDWRENWEKYTRKFDENENNELRVIEQLHYHSANNPKYISEMKQVLRESWNLWRSKNMVERELKLKESFKKILVLIPTVFVDE